MAQSLDQPQVPLANLPLTAEELERSARTDFSVEREGELPVGVQLSWKIRAMIARGDLRPGDRVPSVRELAEFADVNVNTGRAVYQGLERDGLISSEQGRGTFITSVAGELGDLGDAATRAVEDARERGLDPRDLAAVLYSAPSPGSDELPPPPFPDLDPELGARELRATLSDQIGRLEAEIASYAWHDPAQPPPKRPRGGEPVGRLLSVEELEATRSELIDRLRRLRGEAARREANEGAARAHIEEMLEHPTEHRWEMVTTEATGDPGCKNWRVVPKWGPLGAIMGWWRVKVSSGCPPAAPLAAAPDSERPG